MSSSVSSLEVGKGDSFRRENSSGTNSFVDPGIPFQNFQNFANLSLNIVVDSENITL